MKAREEELEKILVNSLKLKIVKGKIVPHKRPVDKILQWHTKWVEREVGELVKELPKLWGEHRASVSHAMEYGTEKDIPNFFTWLKSKLTKGKAG